MRRISVVSTDRDRPLMERDTRDAMLLWGMVGIAVWLLFILILMLIATFLPS